VKKKWATSIAVVALLAAALVGYRLATWEVATVHADYPTITTLEELTRQATVIVVGTVEEVAGTRNTARDPLDPQKPHPSLEIVSVDYQVRVEQVLKGAAPAQLLVTQAKSAAPKGESHVLFEGFKDLAVGQRYLLFLRQTTDGSERWIGIAEPWRFALLNDRIIVESRWEHATSYFPAANANEFLTQVRSYISAN